ncbi:hypothetical protein QR680_016569 [Steinernema hermaphroditum]|uniref:Saposin B-type domain-containing protein n=1 Tax=Steinernema hermaphroditum TaxID=289476 RepID=A0AA39LM63_9BILA|nr:hypothetical protein QR680_016569 [Steinernema hermaphroditum]
MKLLLVLALVGIAATATINDCKVCEHIVKTAEKHFHKGVKDEIKLLRQLQKECLRLVRHYGAQAAIHCDQQVTDHIGEIFHAVKNNRTAKELCVELGDCVGPTGPTRGTGPTTGPTRGYTRGSGTESSTGPTTSYTRGSGTETSTGPTRGYNFGTTGY